MTISASLKGACLGLSAFAVSACASGARQEEIAYVERPVEVLYNEATEALDRRLWDEAAQRFAEVQRQHPYSVWAQRSILMTAYSHYKSQNFEECISAAQEYIALYPGAEGAPYAYYLVGVSQFDQIVDVGREQARSELALAALTEVVRRFPASEYARDAELKLDMVRDQLAGKEMEIGRFYLRRSEHLAAINRFRNVIEKYDTTTHAPEALHRLVEAYLSIGLNGQAQAAAAVLGHNYPASDWYSDSYLLLTSQGVTPEIQPQGDPGWFARMWGRIF